MRKGVPFIVGIMLLIGAAVVPTVTTFITFILPARFASTARIVPTVTDPAAIATEVEIIRSKAVLLPVATNLHLARRWAEKYREAGELPVDLTCLLLSRDCDIKQIKGTHLIEIRVLSDDPTEAAAIANEIALVYTRSPLAARGANGETAPQIIDEATPSWRPAKPNKLLNIGSGIGLGAVLAIIGVWLVVRRDFRRARTLDHSNRSEQPPPLPPNEPSPGPKR